MDHHSLTSSLSVLFRKRKKKVTKHRIYPYKKIWALPYLWHGGYSQNLGLRRLTFRRLHYSTWHFYCHVSNVPYAFPLAFQLTSCYSGLGRDVVILSTYTLFPPLQRPRIQPLLPPLRHVQTCCQRAVSNVLSRLRVTWEEPLFTLQQCKSQW